MVSSCISSFLCFLSFVIYAGVYNNNKPNGAGQFGGGFGLIIWGTLLLASYLWNAVCTTSRGVTSLEVAVRLDM